MLRFSLLFLLFLYASPRIYAAIGDCGQPVSAGTKSKTADALVILRAAVGHLTVCDDKPCICDIDGNGRIQVSDAFRVLKIAVGQNLPLLCSCAQTTTTTTSTGSNCFVATALTVIDMCTGLEWEKKTDANFNTLYTWSKTGTAPDGTVFTNFLAKLNTPPCYAGHCDWRLPTVAGLPPAQPTGQPAELEFIGDCSFGEPCIDPIFGPTSILAYWSSLTYALYPQAAWAVLNGIIVGPIIKTTGIGTARAVRRLH